MSTGTLKYIENYENLRMLKPFEFDKTKFIQYSLAEAQINSLKKRFIEVEKEKYLKNSRNRDSLEIKLYFLRKFYYEAYNEHQNSLKQYLTLHKIELCINNNNFNC